MEIQSRRGYVVIAAMIVIGFTMRHTSISRLYLAPVYMVMGIALIVASGQYFKARRPKSKSK